MYNTIKCNSFVQNNNVHEQKKRVRYRVNALCNVYRVIE